jgi:diaminohydroxyphosphoribosylaminopyrimidine deaminase/5-amino-6-(5-phosphoribosylamino)uracil reductase
VVLDSQLRTPTDARIFQGGQALVVTAKADEHKIAELENAGAQVTVLAGENGRVDLLRAIQHLATIGCNEVLVEAGSTLNGALLNAGLVDELVLYFAPQLLGDMARGLAQLGELKTLDQRVELAWQDVRQVGKDLRILATVNKSPRTFRATG